jgi:hypothetical protein
MGWGLFQRKTVWLPTWRGWLAGVAAAAALLLAVLFGLFPFLAVNQPAPGADILVVEGWAPDDVLDQAVQEYRRGHYRMVLTTGCPIEQGKYTMPFETYAEMALSALKKLGLSEREVTAVPATRVNKDRTYHSAVALRDWLERNAPAATSINVVTHSCHARRTRLLFEKAFGERTKVGVLAYDCRDYGPRDWWRSSAGVRDTVGELIAYAYARTLYRAGRN